MYKLVFLSLSLRNNIISHQTICRCKVFAQYSIVTLQ